MARPAKDIKARILVAASDCFLAHGVDGASLRDIGTRASTNIGMIYYYFQSKDSLFFAVVDTVYDRLMGDLEAILIQTVPVAERMRAAYERLGALSNEELKVVHVVVREMLVASSRREQLAKRFLARHIPMSLSLVREGIAEGTLDARLNPVVTMMALLALGGLPQFIRRNAGAHEPIAAATGGSQLAAELFDILYYGISARARDPDESASGTSGTSTSERG